MTNEQLRIGLPVFATRSFSGVVAGTPGTIVERPNSWPDNDSVAVQWHRHSGDTLVDWFSFDELEFLEVANG